MFFIGTQNITSLNETGSEQLGEISAKKSTDHINMQLRFPQERKACSLVEQLARKWFKTSKSIAHQ